ncbi:MAG TPA: hypothetical protein DCX14_14795 [Flavobacteriales bacterium]|nr:hypothetical protein [Flavobacteriales bacterium]
MVYPSPIAKFGTKDSVKSGDVPLDIQFVNESSVGADSVNVDLLYTWTFGPFGVSDELDPQFTFEQIGNYEVRLLVDNGVCQDSAVMRVQLDRITNFFIPNVFTPNGDQNNDLFEWTIEGIDEFRIVIYNRWGTKVFQSETLDDHWDGGKEPDGTYFYVVTGKEQTLDAETVEYRGDLTLIRE